MANTPACRGLTSPAGLDVLEQLAVNKNECEMSLVVDSEISSCRLTRQIQLGQDDFSVTFQLPNCKLVRTVHWLADRQRCKVRLESVRLTDSCGIARAVELRHVTSTGFVCADGFHLFASKAPCFTLSVEGEVAAISLAGHWAKLDARDEMQLEVTVLSLDVGRGFINEQPVRQPFYLGTEEFSVTFNTASRGPIQAMRWAPPAGSRCKIRVQAISVYDAEGAEVAFDLTTVTSNGFLLADGTHLFATVEPLFFLPVHGNVTAINISGRRLSLDAWDEVKLDAAILHLEGPGVPIRQPYYLGSDSFALTFDTSGHGPVQSARLAPPAGKRCKVRIDSIRCEAASGAIVTIDLACVGSNGIRLPDDSHLFATVEPLLFLPIEGEFNLITIRGQRTDLNAREENQLETSCLYLNDGEGSILRKPVYLGAGSFALTFDLDRFVPVRSLRWAPLPFACCKIQLQSVHYTIAGSAIQPVDLEKMSSNGTVLPDGAHLFADEPPLFTLPIAGNIETITIEGCWWGPLSDREVELEKRSAMSQVQSAKGCPPERLESNPPASEIRKPNHLPTE